MPQPDTDKKSKALEFFKDWSNYLLVTTVAAIGWVAEHGDHLDSKLRHFCIVALGFSAIFGIFTLALVPLVQEARTRLQSNYEVPVSFWFWPALRWLLPKKYRNGMRLTWMCFPQHVLFIAGIVLYIFAQLRR